MSYGTGYLTVAQCVLRAGSSQQAGTRLSLTHLVIKAMGLCLAEVPSINGRLVWGTFYPKATCDVGCLVAVEGGRDLANATVKNADACSLVDVARQVRAQARRLRSGNDADFKKSKPMLRALPTWLLRPVVHAVGFLGCALGMEVGALGVKPFPFGSCVVTSVGMLGLDVAYAPHTPWAHVPVMVTVGAVKDRAWAHQGRVAVRPVLSVTCTADHRYLDGAQGGWLAKRLEAILSDPAAHLGE